MSKIKFKILCLTFFFVFQGVLLFAQVKILDRIVAVVGNDIIMESDLQQQVEFFILNTKIDPNTPNLRNQVLDALINERLIVAKAIEDTNVNVTDEEVSQQLEQLIQQNIQQIGSEQKLEEIYGMPISRMRREFRDEMKKKLLAERIKQFKFGNVSVSRREIEEFYETYRDSLPEVEEEVELYHILKFPKKNQEILNEVKIKAKLILDSIRCCGDFADFARRYSQDPNTAIDGGDLGVTRRGTLVKEYEEAAFALNEGQISEPIESPFGIHIIQLVERRGENIHTRHILLKVESDSLSDQLVIDFLSKISDSVKNGGNFAEFAKKYSEDQESASIGGYIGLVPLSQLSDDMQDLINDLNEGEISQPVRVSSGGSYGFQIIYLKKRIPAHKISLSTDWKRLELYATNYKRNKLYQQWLEELRNEIYWDIRL
ncbi:MAG: Survival protein SurA precursor (Peptidyl-prolyl cis-trans isomerase SurA) [Ignavibacteriae bacterium]|nr:MAG: Survival protein SurA precursor (Peptidyl-prolyl cis-trans isomerase SurA) [Ignavibacteriota bacterium]